MGPNSSKNGLRASSSKCLGIYKKGGGMREQEGRKEGRRDLSNK
jgi:hypothetical protein